MPRRMSGAKGNQVFGSGRAGQESGGTPAGPITAFTGQSRRQERKRCRSESPRRDHLISRGTPAPLPCSGFAYSPSVGAQRDSLPYLLASELPCLSPWRVLPVAPGTPDAIPARSCLTLTAMAPGFTQRWPTTPSPSLIVNFRFSRSSKYFFPATPFPLVPFRLVGGESDDAGSAL